MFDGCIDARSEGSAFLGGDRIRRMSLICWSSRSCSARTSCRLDSPARTVGSVFAIPRAAPNASSAVVVWHPVPPRCLSSWKLQPRHSDEPFQLACLTMVRNIFDPLGFQEFSSDFRCRAVSEIHTVLQACASGRSVLGSAEARRLSLLAFQCRGRPAPGAGSERVDPGKASNDGLPASDKLVDFFLFRSALGGIEAAIHPGPEKREVGQINPPQRNKPLRRQSGAGPARLRKPRPTVKRTQRRMVGTLQKAAR